MTDDPFSFDLENHDEDFIFMPDEVMSVNQAAAREKEIEINEMIILIFVQWYEQQSQGGSSLH